MKIGARSFIFLSDNAKYFFFRYGCIKAPFTLHDTCLAIQFVDFDIRYAK